MTKQRRHLPVTTKGFVWGPRRVELDVSLRELSALTGISLHDLSRLESGRMVATGDEYNKVTAALERVAKEREQVAPA